jgi:hypothetical protein
VVARRPIVVILISWDGPEISHPGGVFASLRGFAPHTPRLRRRVVVVAAAVVAAVVPRALALAPTLAPTPTTATCTAACTAARTAAIWSCAARAKSPVARAARRRVGRSALTLNFFVGGHNKIALVIGTHFSFTSEHFS